METNLQTVSNQAGLSEIEKIFYENFTKRQDSNNDFLLRLLMIVGTVVAGYAYLLFKIDSIEVDKRTMFILLIFIEILLMIYFKIIYDEGYAFRRDQIVVFRILRKHGLISTTEDDDRNPNIVFTYNFNPLKKHRITNSKFVKNNCMVFFLMPAFHNTLSGSIILLQITVYASFCFTFFDSFYIYLLLVLFLINCYVDIKIVLRKNDWLKNLYLKAHKANE